MIKSQDRSGWIGASDTARVVGNWNTKTFENFWAEKLGLSKNSYKSPAMMAGTNYEHRILEAIGITKMDRQIRIKKYRLRVNLDGETDDTIKEVKTHKGEFKVSRAYWQQAQVEMFAAKKKLDIVSYQMTDEEYSNYFLPIDPDRIAIHPIEYDPAWIEGEYLPKLEYLAARLKEKRWP